MDFFFNTTAIQNHLEAKVKTHSETRKQDKALCPVTECSDYYFSTPNALGDDIPSEDDLIRAFMT